MPIVSSLGYYFETAENFLNEGKFWYHLLALLKLRRAPNLSKTSVSAGTLIANNLSMQRLQS